MANTNPNSEPLKDNQNTQIPKNKYPIGDYLKDYYYKSDNLRESDKIYIDNNQNGTSLNKMASVALDTFKYSFENYDDPTFLGFDIVFLTNNSPLFSNGINSASAFIQQYTNIPQIQQRAQLLNIFKNEIAKYFYFPLNFTEFNSGKKSYYISKVAGLNNLNQKIVDTKGDKNNITISLVEDIALSVLRLSELYNNLSYDYYGQRYIIPKNCLRFDVAIIISDMRSLKTPLKSSNGKINKTPYYSDNGNIVGETLTKQKSHHIYLLRDCNFNFYDSQSHSQEISQGGFSSVNSDPATIEFKIEYKSIERILNPILLSHNKSENTQYEIKNKSISSFKNSSILDNKSIYSFNGYDDILNIIKKIDKGGENNIIYDIGTPIIIDQENVEKTNENQQLLGDTLKGYNPEIVKKEPPVPSFKDKALSEFRNVKDNLKKTGKEYVKGLENTIIQTIDKTKTRLLNEFAQKRGELLNTLMDDLRNTTNVPKIYPDNVYEIDLRTYKENIAKALGTELYNDTEKAILKGNADLFNNLGNASSNNKLGNI